MKKNKINCDCRELKKSIFLFERELLERFKQSDLKLRELKKILLSRKGSAEDRSSALRSLGELTAYLQCIEDFSRCFGKSIDEILLEHVCEDSVFRPT